MTNRKGFSLVVSVVAVFAVLLLANYFIGMNPSSLGGANAIKKFASYAELEDFVKKNSEGTGAGYYYGPSLRTMEAVGAAATPGTTATTTYSGTNVQVEGVDEADIVKTDGGYIYVVSSGNRKVAIADAVPAENAKIVSEINFSGSVNVNEIFVNKDRLVVFWQEYAKTPTVSAVARMMPTMFRYSALTTHVDVYDITDRASPVLAKNISIDGNYFSSRMIGNTVYVIATTPAYYREGEPIPLPAIRTAATTTTSSAGKFPEIYYFDASDRSYTFTTVAALDVMDNGAEPSGKILLTGATSNMYVSLDNIYLAYSKYTNTFESDIFIENVILPLLPSIWQNEVKSIRANSTLSRSEKLDGVQRVVEDFIRSLSPDEQAQFEVQASARLADVQTELLREREKTVVQKLAISGGKVEYETSGEVPGTALNQFSMDEHNGYFRIATTITDNNAGRITPMMGITTSGGTTGAMIKSEPAGITAEEQKRLDEMTAPVTTSVVPPRVAGPTNNVYVLDGDLKTVGILEDLAPGERIYSVRFMGDKAYMVTFRQVDPLFVIDLSRPAEPKILGFLKIPGVSDYLHPYDDTHVIGLGRDASEEGRILGMKLSLFDVSNVSAPREISKYIIGGRGTSSEALSDHKAFLFSREKSLLVIPVSEWHEFLGGGEAMGRPWISYYSQGAYVFNLDLTNGFVLKGKISHMGNETSDDWDATVRRSLYIDDVLYTVSNKKVVANKLSDMSEVSEVELPQAHYPQQDYECLGCGKAEWE